MKSEYSLLEIDRVKYYSFDFESLPSLNELRLKFLLTSQRFKKQL